MSEFDERHDLGGTMTTYEHCGRLYKDTGDVHMGWAFDVYDCWSWGRGTRGGMSRALACRTWFLGYLRVAQAVPAVVGTAADIHVSTAMGPVLAYTPHKRVLCCCSLLS